MATQQKRQTRLRRKKRIRKKVAGDAERPRLTVFRSNKHIYAQVIDDGTHQALASVSDRAKKGVAADLQGKDKKERAKAVGIAVAKACSEKGIKKVVFDRNGYAFHGRVHALADGAREGGLEF